MEETRPRVLFIDYCIGFGGATKSLALVFDELRTVERVLLSSQARDVLDVWFSGVSIHRFRTMLNYRSRARMREWIARKPSRSVVGALLLRAFAALDACVVVANVLRIMWIARKERIDLLHLNNGFIPPEALVAGRLLRKPLVVHMRGMPTSTHGSRRSSPQRAAKVIAVSHAVSKPVTDIGVSADRITVIHDPVDVDRFDKAAGERSYVREIWGLETSDIAVGILGRVVEWKGQFEFTQAILKALLSNSRIMGVIIGDESDGAVEYFRSIQALIRGSGWSHRFHLTGYQEDVEPSYAALDIVVHASIEPEPFGMVVTEAMASKRPIIASASGGPLEVITQEVDGLLVPPRDVGALARAILRLASDPILRVAMGARGYEKVRDRFTINQAAGKVRSVYDEMIGQASRHLP